MLRHITGLILLLASTNTLCQNIQSATIEWTCNSTFTVQPGTFSEEITKVVSSAGEIVWYDQSSSVRETFTITGIQIYELNVTTKTAL